MSFVRKLPSVSGDSEAKSPPANAGATGDPSSGPGSGRPPGEGNGNPLQHSYRQNPMDRGSWQATVHRGSQGVGQDLETEQKQSVTLSIFN